MFDNIFGGIGKGCASHPWEVIVGVLTVTACMLSMDKSDPSMSAAPNSLPHATKIVVSIRKIIINKTFWTNRGVCRRSFLLFRVSIRYSAENDVSILINLHVQDDEAHAIDVIFMTLIRCIAVLYCYYQFNNLRQLESKYVLGKNYNTYYEIKKQKLLLFYFKF